MLDRNITICEQNPTTSIIHEHRAPTDESVKLLREMEKEARERVISSFVFSDNQVKGSVVVMLNVMTSDKTVYIRYSLNGTEHKEEFTIQDIEILIDRTEALKLLIERLSWRIAVNLVCESGIKL